MTIKDKRVKAFFAEYLGTLLLTLGVILSINSGAELLPTAVVAAGILTLMVYLLGPISGAHLNPAVTFALILEKKIKLADALDYFFAQLTAAGTAILVNQYLLQIDLDLVDDNTLRSFSVEALGAFILIFAIIFVVEGKISKELSGLIIGLALLMGIAIAAPVSLGLLNPAVALGTKTLTASYFIAPLVGGFFAVGIYRLLNR